MSDSGIVNTTERYIAQLERRVENLERRALSLAGPLPVGGCCELYCCEEEPFTLLDDVGESALFCTTDIEEVSMGRLRLLVTGAFVMIASGSGPANLIWNVQVGGTNYAPSYLLNLNNINNGEEFTFPFHNVVDVTSPTTTVALFIQNGNTTDITITAVSLSVQVFATDEGSLSCGTVLGS